MTQRYDFGDGKLVPIRIHGNGGGVIALTAQVDDTVYVGAGCCISGFARLSKNVRISGRVKIHGENLSSGISVQIEDDVIVSGSVQISGVVLLRDRAEIRENVRVSGCVQVMHRARVTGNAVLDGDIQVMDSAHITGSCRFISPDRRLIFRGEHFVQSQTIEQVVRNENQRKKRVTALRPLVFTHLQATKVLNIG